MSNSFYALSAPPSSAARGLTLDPASDHVDHVLALVLVELAALVDPVPLPQTRAAAGRGRVLGAEHRVAAPGRLLAVVARSGGCQALVDEVARMSPDGLHPAQLHESA